MQRIAIILTPEVGGPQATMEFPDVPTANTFVMWWQKFAAHHYWEYQRFLRGERRTRAVPSTVVEPRPGVVLYDGPHPDRAPVDDLDV